MKKTVILLVIAVLPILSFGQVYFSQVIEDLILVGPENIEESIVVSKSYYTYLVTTKQLLKEMQRQNEMVLDELRNKKTLKRRDKRQIKDAETKQELISKDFHVIRYFQHLWWMPNRNDYQPLLSLYNYLQNGQCATIFTSTDTLFMDDYEIRTDEIDTVTELIPIEKFKEQFWKQLEHDGEKIFCLVEKEGYRLSNYYGPEMEIKKCPADFTFSNDRKYCQRKSPLSFTEKPLSIRIFNKKTKEEVTLESWQASDCQ